jgi:hypothetical protein
MQENLWNHWFHFLQTLLCLLIVVLLLLLFACSGGGSNSGSQGEDTLPGDYSYLYAYNAYRLDGHTTRWPSTTIPVYGATGVGWEEAISRWPAVRFQFVATKPSSGIDILGYEDLGNICGLSSFTYNSAGKMEWCTVAINILHNEMNCGLVTDTLTHEIGHCIGVFKHTRDGGLMDEKASGSGDITSAVSDMLSLLYSLAPGADINDKLAAKRPDKTRGKSRYQPDGRTHYSGGLAVLTRR